MGKNTVLVVQMCLEVDEKTFPKVSHLAKVIDKDADRNKIIRYV